MEQGKPKAAPVVGIVLTALAVLLLVGVATFAGPCAHGGAETPSCVWAQRAVLGAGAVLAVLAIVRIFETDEGERRGLSLGCALVGAYIGLVPGMIIGLCPDAGMPCNAIMHPFVSAIGLAVFLVGAIDLTRRLLSLRK